MSVAFLEYEALAGVLRQEIMPFEWSTGAQVYRKLVFGLLDELRRRDLIAGLSKTCQFYGAMREGSNELKLTLIYDDGKIFAVSEPGNEESKKTVLRTPIPLGDNLYDAILDPESWFDALPYM